MNRTEARKLNDLSIARTSYLWPGAVLFLRNDFDSAFKADIRGLHEEDPESWWTPYHLFWGMGVRNALRKNGFGEDDFGIENLDNIYIELVEEAVLEEPVVDRLDWDLILDALTNFAIHRATRAAGGGREARREAARPVEAQMRLIQEHIR